MKAPWKLASGLVGGLAVTVLVAGCGDNDDTTTGPQTTTVVDAAAADGRFGTLVSALQTTGLDETLSGTGPFTVFAPTDAAFALLPTDALAGSDLAAVLTYHVIAGEVGSGAVVGLTSATTVQGDDLSILVDGGTVVLDGRVQVIETDIQTDNGIIHVIDAVLVPGTFPGDVVDMLAASPRFSSLVGAVSGAGLAATLADDTASFTVFAPTNAAFAPLDLTGVSVSDVLTYHVLDSAVGSSAVVGLSSATTVQGSDVAIALDGGTVVLDGRVQVTTVDLEASNGIVHVVDAVLTPGAFPGTVVDVLVASPRFSSLVDAVVAADLASTLAGGTFTIFAPTNNAFSGVDLSGLTMPQLTDVLTYHAVTGSVDAAAVTSMSSATTVQGSDIMIATGSGVVLNGNVNVTFTDIQANNGIVHVLDGVLALP